MTEQSKTPTNTALPSQIRYYDPRAASGRESKRTSFLERNYSLGHVVAGVVLTTIIAGLIGLIAGTDITQKRTNARINEAISCAETNLQERIARTLKLENYFAECYRAGVDFGFDELEAVRYKLLGDAYLPKNQGED